MCIRDRLAARWEDEVVYRFAPDEPCALIIAVGCSDIPAGISTPRSRLNLANITDRASTLGIPSMVVGPPPLAGVQSSAVKELSLSCQQVCERRDIPFVDTYTPLDVYKRQALFRARRGRHRRQRHHRESCEEARDRS